MSRRARGAALLAGLLAALAPGCASDGIEVREYVLTSLAQAGADVPAEGDLTIGVGPVRVPRYLRRSGIVTRVGVNELQASDTQRWGEDLDRGLARVVAENLAVLVPGAQVRAFPWADAARMDYRVAIDVERFERSPDGSVALDARWSLRRRKAAAPVIRRASFVQESSGPDHASSVGAMSRAAALLSEEITAAIRSEAGSW